MGHTARRLTGTTGPAAVDVVRLAVGGVGLAGTAPQQQRGVGQVGLDVRHVGRTADRFEPCGMTEQLTDTGAFDATG